MIAQVTSISTSSMSCWTFLSCESSTPGPHAVAPRTVDDVDGGLTMVVKKLREGARLAHVSRCRFVVGLGSFESWSHFVFM